MPSFTYYVYEKDTWAFNALYSTSQTHFSFSHLFINYELEELFKTFSNDLVWTRDFQGKKFDRREFHHIGFLPWQIYFNRIH